MILYIVGISRREKEMRYKNKRTVLIYMLVFLLVSLAGMLYSERQFFNNFSRIFYGGIIVVWAMTVLRRIIVKRIIQQNKNLVNHHLQT